MSIVKDTIVPLKQPIAKLVIKDLLSYDGLLLVVKEKDNLLVKKKSLETAIDKFLDKFPDYWTPSKMYANSLKDLVEYINQLRENIDKLEIIKMTIQNMNYEFYTSNSIKKLLNFNNY